MSCKNKIPAYVYYIEHIFSGKFYYGSRYKHIVKNRLPEEDFLIYYFTSSKELQTMIKTEGIKSFISKIIYKDLNYEQCYRKEQDLIKEHKNNPLCLNKRFFDYTKHKIIFSNFGKTLSTKGIPKSEETKQKMRKPKSESHRRNISIAQKLNGGNGPKYHKEESKQKTRETMKLLPRPNKTCTYCGKVGGFISMSRWHFENCREKL